MAVAKVINATFVVVGGGIAGVSCVEHLSYLCPDEPTVLLSASNVIKTVANLSQLTKLLATFDVIEKSVDEYSSEHSTMRVVHSQVKRVDATKHEIETSTGQIIVYKYLCLCHGARPKMIESDNKFVLGIRDTESVKQFQDHLSGSRRIAVIGNGGIANELIHELKGVDIVWIIKDDSVNATFVDAGAGQFFFDELSQSESSQSETSQNETSPGDTSVPITKRPKYTAKSLDEGSAKTSASYVLGGALGPDWHEGIGVSGSAGHKKVNIEYECEVKRVLTSEEFDKDNCAKNGFRKTIQKMGSVQETADGQSWNVYLELTNGNVYGFDFVVSATGVIPNGDQIQVIGENDSRLLLSDDGSIIVNEQMETNLPDVYAAGDVCHTNWESNSKHWFQMRLWTQARQMGLYSAQCMSTHFKSGGKEKQMLDFCFEMFTHVTKFFGHKVILLGLFNGQGLGTDCEVLLRTTKGKEYVKTVMQAGRMQGALLIGETDLEETFENLILNQMDLSDFGVDLLDPNIDIEDFFD